MDPGSPSRMDNHSTWTMGASTSAEMNPRSPGSMMDFESISSRDLEVFTPASDDSDTIKPVTNTSGPWRVAHTLKNQDNVKLETPTAPALIFWYISLSPLLILGKVICGSHIALLAIVSSSVFVQTMNPVTTSTRSTTSPPTLGLAPRVTTHPRSLVSMTAFTSPGNPRVPTPAFGIRPPTDKETGDLHRFSSEQASRHRPHQSSKNSAADSIWPGSPSTPMAIAPMTFGSLTP
jgi:hypothetical protein